MASPRTKKQPPRRAPRSSLPLTRERIVEAALALVGDESLAGLTTRKLGDRLGCEAMSIYHHFPSKQHLLDALVSHALASVEVPKPGVDPEAQTRAVLDSYRAMARRWPALFPLVAVHRLNMPAGIRFIESVLELFQALTGDAEAAARHFRTVGYFLVGACLDETAGYARGPSAAEPVDAAFMAREAPRLLAAAPYFQESQWDETWRLGVDAVLAAVPRTARTVPVRRRRKPTSAA